MVGLKKIGFRLPAFLAGSAWNPTENFDSRSWRSDRALVVVTSDSKRTITGFAEFSIRL